MMPVTAGSGRSIDSSDVPLASYAGGWLRIEAMRQLSAELQALADGVVGGGLWKGRLGGQRATFTLN